MSVKKPLPELIPATPPKYVVEELPTEPFYAGIVRKRVGENHWELVLGEHRLRFWYSGSSYKVHLRSGKTQAGNPRRIQRSLHVKQQQSGLEGAVCFLRAIARGELIKLLNR